MRATVKYALIFATLAIVTKIVLWQAGLLNENTSYSGMAYLFYMLLMILLALREHKQREVREKMPFFQDVKTAMQSVALFAVITAAFTYIYYSYLDTDFFANKIQQRMEMAESVNLDELEGNVPKTREEFVQQEKNLSEMIFSPFNHATLTLVGFLIIGGIYSIVVVLLVRKNIFY